MFKSTRKYLIIALAIPAGLLAQNELASQLNDPSITRLIPAIVACDGASCAALDKSFIRAVKARVSRGAPQTYSAIFYREALSDQIHVRTTTGIQEWVCLDVINCRFSGIPEQWVVHLKKHSSGAYQIELPPIRNQAENAQTIPDSILPPPNLSKTHSESRSTTGSATTGTDSLSATVDLVRTHTDTRNDSLTETIGRSPTESRERASTRTSTDTRSGRTATRTATPSLMPDLTPVVHTVAVAGVDPGQGLGGKDVPALTWNLGMTSRPAMSFSAASSFCANEAAGWRLPTVWELYALYLQRALVASDQYSTGAGGHATSSVLDANSIWCVYWTNGVVTPVGMGANFAVRCVR